MEDQEIVRLYWDRNEQAIAVSSEKYGAYCTSIARNILPDRSDAEECVNDTWFRAWNSMPPHRPAVLAAFFGKITRNLSFDCYKKLHREKRGGYNVDLVLDELAEVVSGKDDPEKAVQQKELMQEINRFLQTLPKEKRYMFILRYWYADSIPSIAGRFHVNRDNVSVILNRVRKQLRVYLTERGYDI